MNLIDPKIKDEIFLSKKCAWLYYVAKLSQNQIAKKLGLSKMRIHRLIALAEKIYNLERVKYESIGVRKTART